MTAFCRLMRVGVSSWFVLHVARVAVKGACDLRGAKRR
jgi:hypothetical protein